MLPLKVSEKELADFFFTGSYNNLTAPKFGGSLFGKHMAQHISLKIPTQPEHWNSNNNNHYTILPFMDSLFEFCLPFAAMLTDLYMYNKQATITFLQSAIEAAGKQVTILCHSLLISWPISSPVVAELVEIMLKMNIKFCNHCMDEMENYSILCKELQSVDVPPVWKKFSKGKIPLEYIKSGLEIDKRVNNLGEFSSQMKYSSELLEETFLKEQTKVGQPNTASYQQHQTHIQDITNIYFGARVKNSIEPIFTYKVGFIYLFHSSEVNNEAGQIAKLYKCFIFYFPSKC